MADKPPTSNSKSLIFLLYCIITQLLFCCWCCRAQSKGLFVFGSSLVDNGNNNFQNTNARANYEPYGVDFPQGPTGRFTNGKNVIDALGDLLHLPSIPAFRNPTTNGQRIVHGVDFASGGSGILDDTGSLSGNVTSLNQQIKNFEQVTLPELKVQLGNNIAPLSEYLFVLGTAGNDLQNYLLPINLPKPSIDVFTANLTQTLSMQIQKLYTLGARKFVLLSVYPLGCIPFIKNLLHVNRGCVDVLNRPALLFNSQLKSLVDSLKPKLPGSQLVYVDTYNIIFEILRDPIPKGFRDTDNACCKVSTTSVMCIPGGSVCGNRRTYVFFDALHQTQAVTEIIARKAFSSGIDSEVYPINVEQLAAH